MLDARVGNGGLRFFGKNRRLHWTAAIFSEDKI
jgi:hypothetical protein